MGRSSGTTAAVAGMLLLAHGDVPQTSAFVPPTASGALQRLPSWHHPVYSSRVRETSSPAGHRRQSGAAPANTRTEAPNNCNFGRRASSIPTCCVASTSSGDDAGAGPSTASPLPGGVASAAVVEESKERKEGGSVPEVGRNDTWGGGGGLIPVAAAVGTGDAGEAEATSGAWGVVERSLEPEFEWEGGAGAGWTEFEDWLVQDTYSRCDSDKHDRERFFKHHRLCPPCPCMYDIGRSKPLIGLDDLTTSRFYGRVLMAEWPVQRFNRFWLLKKCACPPCEMKHRPPPRKYPSSCRSKSACRVLVSSPPPCSAV